MRQLDRVRRLLARTIWSDDPHCLVCHRPVRAQEARLRISGDALVHRGCATYRRQRVRSRARRLRDPLG
jgi:hypothetical protein